MEKETDEALMLRYQAGDAAAFEVLYRRHKTPLYRYMMRNCKDKAISEELYQDVWTNLIKARERYEPKAKFTTLLYRMAHNRLVDYYRRQGTQSLVNVDENETSVEELPHNSQVSAEQSIDNIRALDCLLLLIDALPDEQRQVFLLRQEAALSIQEIASCIGINSETAKSRLRYAMKKLKEGLSEYESG